MYVNYLKSGQVQVLNILIWPKCHLSEVGRIFLCIWKGIIYLVSVVGGFDCPQYLIYIRIAEICDAIQTHGNAVHCNTLQLLRWRHKSAKTFVCWAKLWDDPCGVPFIPQSSPVAHISCRNWWKVGISGLPCKKSDTHTACVGTRQASWKKSLERYSYIFKILQELQMLSSVTFKCQVTNIVMNSDYQLSEL